MKLSFRSLFVLSLLMLGLSACGGQSTENNTPDILSSEDNLIPPPDKAVNTVQASSLQKVLFNYATSSESGEVQSAIASLELPDQSKTILGNITVALDVIDANGIEEILLDFSNGDSDLPALQICGGTSASCTDTELSADQTDNTAYRVFINGINPHDYAWENGPNIINVWVDNSQGQRSIATTFNLNWQAVVIAQTQAEFTGVVANESTGDKTGNLAISWSEVPGYLFYNVFIATESGINSDTFTTLADGQARLSLESDNVVIEGLDAKKEYFFTVSGVDDGGESAFSLERSVFDSSNGAPVAQDDNAQVDENASVVINVLENDSDDSPDSSLVLSQITNGANGQVTDNQDGSVTYTHDGSQTTSDQFTYKINDGEFDSVTAIVNIVITLVNDAPISQNDTASVGEGGSVIIDVRSNDSDEESLTPDLSVTVIGQASHGTIVNNNDGTVTYSHDGGETLSDSFSYSINDGEIDSALATVSLSINGINDSPQAADDPATVDENSSVIIDLRTNDGDAETTNSDLIITNISIASYGTIVNNNDGTVTYNHDGSETLSDSFTYTINDGDVDSPPATVSLSINGVNDLPQATNDLANVNEGGSVIINLLSNDSDAETANSALIITNLSAASNGTIVNNNDGTVTYSHGGSETLSDNFSYSINDGEVDSLLAAVSLSINSINDSPLAMDDTGNVDEASSVIIDLRSNDSDAETANSALIITNLSIASHGTIVNNNDGTVTYSHDGSETLSDNFSYTINDGEVDSALAAVSLSINGVNDLPQATNDLAGVDEGNSVLIDLLSNDSDAETVNSALIITNLSAVSNGTIVNNNDGTVTYSHDGSETLSDSFTYSINDGDEDSTPATVLLSIVGVNDAPQATDDLANADEGGSVIIDLGANDSDAETANSALIITNLSLANHGTIVNNSDGTVTYSHDGSETLSDSFSYTVNDGEVDSPPATVLLTISAVNDIPLATDDLANADEGSSVNIDLRSNDSDAETANTTLTITSLSTASHGAIVNNSDGTVTYSHDGSETLSDSFTYSISDGELNSALATVSLSINGINDIPQATDDLANADEGGSVIIDLGANDSDAETANSALIITNLSAASHGTIVNNSDGTVTYSHDGSETLSDSFSYTVNDGEVDSSLAGVSLSINSVNDSPLAADDAASVDEGSSVIIDLRSNDSDAETANTTLTITNLSAASNGTILNNNDGTVTYSHDGSETLSDSFTYTINDGEVDSTLATVSLSIIGINDAPSLSATLTLVEIAEDALVNDSISSVTAIDPEGDAQIWEISAGNTDGVFAVDTSGNVTIVDISELNYEVTSQYTLTISAVDSIDPTVFETIDITIDVSDVTENQELFLDALFGSNGETSFNTYSFQDDDEIVSTLRQSDGKLVMVVNVETSQDNFIATIRLNTDGSVDTSYADNGRRTFEISGSEYANNAVLDPADNLYIVGNFDGDMQIGTMVLKIDSGGNLDTGFGIDGIFELEVEFNHIDGKDILLHSSGDIYIAASSPLEFNVSLFLIRIDAAGELISLNEDGGFDQFGFSGAFTVVGLDEISTGELVVFGTNRVPDVTGDGNFAAAVIEPTDFSQSSIINASFNVSGPNWQSVNGGETHTVAIKSDGSLWAWGGNSEGQLGDGTNNDVNTPVQIGSDTNWHSVSGDGFHSVAIKSDGSLWAWGRNSSGQLGDGTNISKNTPVQIGIDTNWQSVSAGFAHTVAIKSDGSLWAWGHNFYGQLGDGTNNDKNTPVQIGSDTNWQSVSAGGYVLGPTHTVATKSDGSLWAWGYNFDGQLGDGTNIDKNTPVQTGSDTDWQSVNAGGLHSVALKSDGSLWAWGYNFDGQLGDGTSDNHRNKPVQIGSDTNWQSVNGGGLHSVAVKSDGSLWAWGYNVDGQLGDGTTTNSNEPILIDFGLNWRDVSGGAFHTTAIDSDGSLWAWGKNEFGQLGDSTNSDSSEPIQNQQAGISSDDIARDYLRVNNDSFIIAGDSNYLNGGGSDEVEATMIKIDVTNSAITLDSTFATSGVFTYDVDGDEFSPSSIQSVDLDSSGNITFVADSIIDDENVYFIDQITSAGEFNWIASQIYYAGFPALAASDIIIDTLTDDIYLAYVAGLSLSDDIVFNQLLNNGSEVVASSRELNFSSSDEYLNDLNLLSVAPNSSVLWVNTEKPVDSLFDAGSLSLLNSDGLLDHSLNNGVSTLIYPDIFYGPSLELADGSIISTSYDIMSDVLIIYKTTDTELTPDEDFVPGFGYYEKQFQTNGLNDLEVNDISYDASSDHIIIVGDYSEDELVGFVIKVDATTGEAYTGGDFSDGLLIVSVSFLDALDRVIPQTDGTLVCFGSISTGQFINPYLMKLMPDGSFDSSFNGTGLKTYDLGLVNQDLEAVDLVQLADSSLIFAVNNITSSTSHVVKTDVSGNLVSEFADSGVMNLAIGSSATVTNDITLDSSESIYAVGYASNSDDDSLLVKISSLDGSLDPVFNSNTTPGFWMFDEGGFESLSKVLFDPLNEHIILGDTKIGPIGYMDIRIRAYNLIQNDN
jgi:uncharacterized delta-60 repeat protein